MKRVLIFILFILSNYTYAQLAGELGVLDVTANGGINPETGVDWAAGDSYRLVFVSTTTRDATSTDIADYNTHIQNTATAAGLGAVNWYAIASTNTVDARDNTLTRSTDTDGAFFLMNGSEVVANNISDLWDGTINTRIDLDENGALRPNDTPIWTTWTAVWTGTKDNGTKNGTFYLGGSTITIGLARAELKFWENRSRHSDNSVSLPLYGISEVLTVQTVLPVHLTSFEASITNGYQVEINWQTASEESNDYFTIERSSDGIEWEELKRVDGAGTSSTPISYQVYDYHPNVGISYYRLKQTDFDGQFSYSRSVTTLLDIENNVLVYPNPTTSVTNIIGREYDVQEVRIFNSFGQDVTPITKIKIQGELKISIDLSNLEKGIYWIKAKNISKKIYKH